jgi:N-acetylglucosamine kinase-like BadF-type ATPase
LVYAPDFGAAGFAALADLVSLVAREGDLAACRILEEAGRALVRSALAVFAKLDFGDQPKCVAPVGGAFEHVAGLRDVFVADLKRQRREIEVRDALQSPAHGALLMAKRSLDPT